MSEYKAGELVLYRAISGPVKGKVVSQFRDIDGWYVAFKVVSLRHPYYPKGMEVVVPLDTPFLTKRERYSRG